MKRLKLPLVIEKNYPGILLLFLAILVLLILFPTSPIKYPVPDRDSGVFLYIAKSILHGGVPYRDVWDHKPPGIYLINIVGLLLGNESLWGIWFLECLAVFTGLAIGFRLFQKSFGILPATITILIGLIQLSFLLVEGSNYTEIFALPFQYLVLWQFSSALWIPNSKWIWLKLGITGAIVFLLRQNLIGIWIAAICVLFYYSYQSRCFKQLWGRLAFFSIGIAIPISTAIMYFIVSKSLYTFWDAAFSYNLNYSQTTPGFLSHKTAIIEGIRNTWQSGIIFFALIGWIIELGLIVVNSKNKPKNEPIILLVLFGLPIEFILVSISGRNYPHYFITWLPVFSVITVRLIFNSITYIHRDNHKVSKNRITLICLPLVMLLITRIIAGFQEWPNDHVKKYTYQRNEVINYIMSNTHPNDTILFWGAEASINFMTKRQSPTRFVYQYPLFTGGYQTSDMISEFQKDLLISKPIIIIDAWRGTDKIPPLDFYERLGWKSPWYPQYKVLPEMEAVIEYIHANYEQIDELGIEKWRVYRLRYQP